MKKKMSGKKAKKTDRNRILWGLFFGKLIENMDASVMVSDAKARVVFVNSRYRELFRVSEKSIIGKDWIRSIIPEPWNKVIRGVFANIRKSKTLCMFETTVRSKGREKYMYWIGIPLRQKRSDLFMFIGREGKYSFDRKVKIHAPTRRKLEKAYKEIVETLFGASRHSDPETAEHSVRVMRFAVALGKRIGLSKVKIERLKIAALLHDLGKLAIDERILFKEGRLTKEEFDEIKKHPRWGSEVVSMVNFLDEIIPIMSNHHENYDGSGYPNGVRGENIPLESRVLTVADVFEALTADRPYRRGFSRKEAMAIMENEKGRKFDPRVTEIFLEMVRKGKFKRKSVG